MLMPQWCWSKLHGPHECSYSVEVLAAPSFVANTCSLNWPIRFAGYTEHVLAYLTNQIRWFCCLNMWANEKVAHFCSRESNLLEKTQAVATCSVAVQEPATSSCCIPSWRCCGSKKLLKTMLSAAAQQQLTVPESVYFVHVLERTL